MALQNHPDLYTGGAVKFDPRPHTQLYVQLKQREQAKNEAFDEYVRNLNKNINSAGLRNQERPIFEQKLAEWQKFGMENRDKLRNPRQDKGGASLEFQNKYQDILNLVSESKMEEEKKKPLIEIATDPNKRDRLSENIIPDIASHDAPLYVMDKNGQTVRNPNRKSFDVSKIMFDPKPFEQDKYFKSFDDVKRSDLSPEVIKNPKDMTQTVTTTSVFDQNAKDLVATRAVGELMSNKSFKKTVSQLDPKEYNDFFKQNYGHDIENEGDLAAAYTLKGLQQKTVKSELKDDTLARQRLMEGIRQANRKELIPLRAAAQKAGGAANDLWIDTYIDNKTEEAVPSKYKQGDKWVTTKEISLDPVLEKALVVNGSTADFIKLMPDGSYRYGLYKRSVGKDGKTTEVQKDGGTYAVDNESVRTISSDALKLALGKQSGVKQMNKEMGVQKGTQQAQPTKKKEIKRSDIPNLIKGRDYTISEYEKLLKDNGVKIID